MWQVWDAILNNNLSIYPSLEPGQAVEYIDSPGIFHIAQKFFTFQDISRMHYERVCLVRSHASCPSMMNYSSDA